MSLVEGKCRQCGAGIEFDSSKKTGVCPHCGTKYLTKDVIINNYSNYTYNESIDGKNINRQAVLEKMLINYYNQKFDDIDNLKEYSFKVLELDTNNVLANFVAFKDITDNANIIELLKNVDLKIDKDLFETLIDYISYSDGYNYFYFVVNSKFNNEEKIDYLCRIKDPKFQILNNLKNDNKFEVVKTFLTSALSVDYMQLLTFISIFKFNKTENNELVRIIENLPTTSKYLFAKQLLTFLNSNPDFAFGNKEKYEQKYEKYKLMQKKLNEKKKEEHKAQKIIIKETVKQEIKTGKRHWLFGLFKKKK